MCRGHACGRAAQVRQFGPHMQQPPAACRSGRCARGALFCRLRLCFIRKKSTICVRLMAVAARLGHGPFKNIRKCLPYCSTAPFSDPSAAAVWACRLGSTCCRSTASSARSTASIANAGSTPRRAARRRPPCPPVPRWPPCCASACSTWPARASGPTSSPLPATASRRSMPTSPPSLPTRSRSAAACVRRRAWPCSPTPRSSIGPTWSKPCERSTTTYSSSTRALPPPSSGSTARRPPTEWSAWWSRCVSSPAA